MPTCPFCAKQVPDESFVCPHCLRAQPVVIPNSRRQESSKKGVPGWVRPVALLAALVGLGSYAFRDYHRAPPPEPVVETVAAPPTITIAPPLDLIIADSAAAKIAPGGHLAFVFSGRGRTGCRVRGSVQGLSGGDRQVEVSIVDRDGLTELEAGRKPRTYYESGSTSAASLDLNLDGRTEYVLVVANPGSRGRAKTVRLRSIRADCAD
jgi:hypothetical protein